MGRRHDRLALSMQAAAECRQRGAAAVPAEERVEWQTRYFEVLAAGFTAQAPPAPSDTPQQQGRRKQTAAKNLLDDLLRWAGQGLALVDDLRVPFTNNQAERDRRLLKVHQKSAGPFRSQQGATAFCRIRSSLSTMRKQGPALLAALAAVFVGKPLPIAWGTGDTVVFVKRQLVMCADTTDRTADSLLQWQRPGARACGQQHSERLSWVCPPHASDHRRLC